MNFPEKWTGDIVKKMHLNGINQSQISEEIGVSREIVCKTLSGKYQMKNAKERFSEAIDSIIDRRK